MRKLIGLGVVLAALLLMALLQASLAAGPHGDNVPNFAVNRCNTCHYGGNYSDPPTGPQFRVDYFNNSRVWDAALAALDSDGDGFTNGQELGDPAGTWQTGDPEPGDPALVSNPSDPLSTPGQPSDPVVARGKYLVDGIGTCGNCHTPQGPTGPQLDRYLAGGAEWDEAFGKVYASNITPDAATGIGSWTDEQITRAIREGARPDGTVLFPLMPYKLYREMSDNDVAAIVAYLRTVPPVSNAVPPRQLNIPDPPAPDPITEPVPDPPAGDPVALGEYLTRHVGDCVLCHTPIVSPYFDINEGQLFAGGNPFHGPWGTIYTANLTPDATGLAGWSDAQIVSAIRERLAPEDRRLLPPMGYSFYNTMTDDDLAGIVAFLRSLTPVSNTVPAPVLNPISGRVVDDKGAPVEGAVIAMRATSLTTTTAADGTFTLDLTPSPDLGGGGQGVGVDRYTGLVAAWKAGYYIQDEGALPGDTDVEITLYPYPTTDDPKTEWIYPRRADSPPEVDYGCDTCHTDAVMAQWNQNAHARAATSPRFFSMYNATDVAGTPGIAPGFKLDFPGIAGTCAACHAPGAAADAPFTADMNRLSPPDTSGVFCDFCHKTARVYINRATGLPYPNVPGVLSHELRRPPEGEGMFFGPYTDIPDPDTYLPQLVQSEICAGCHTFSFWGTPIYQSFAEWLASPFADEGVRCQDCHMKPDPAIDHFVRPEKGGFIRDPMTIASHNQPGAEDVELLQNTVAMTVTAQTAGDRVRVEVEITNTGAGHHVPTDHPARHLLLVVTAETGAGADLTYVGEQVIPAWGGVGADPDDYGGRPGKAFAKVLRDRKTGEVPAASYWNPTIIVSDNRIPARATDVSTYEFQAPPPGTTVNVEGRLIFRRAFKDLMEAKHWNTPDIVMEVEATSLVVP